SSSIREKTRQPVKQAAKRIRNRRSVICPPAGMELGTDPERGEYSMFDQAAATTIALDARTLFIVASCVTSLLGMLLMVAWRHARVPALGWWGAAYLVGAFAASLWAIGSGMDGWLASVPAAALFAACGMTWNAARIFHARRILWPAMLAGSAI